MKGLAVKYALSIALGVVLVWLAFRGEDWSDIWMRLQSVEKAPLFGYIVLFAGAHFLRMIRWGVLVRALGTIGWKDILSAGAVGYMCIMIFPLRLGEFVRPVLVRGIGGVTASGALATVVVERVIDGILFVALFFIFITLLPASGHPAVGAVKLSAYAAGLVFVIALAVMVGAYLKRDQTVAFIGRLGNRIHAGLTEKAIGLLEAFIDGLKVLPDYRRLGIFLLLTVIYWAALGFGMKLVGTAAHIPDLTITGGFALLTVLTVGIMVPGGPGFAGTFEFALKGGFALLVLSEDSQANIALYIIILHVAQLFVQVSFGAVYLIAGKVRFADLVPKENKIG
jgi:uncharacterized protein (TIRG00374 family)